MFRIMTLNIIGLIVTFNIIDAIKLHFSYSEGICVISNPSCCKAIKRDKYLFMSVVNLTVSVWFCSIPAGFAAF